jgi:hypothetical protein
VTEADEDLQPSADRGAPLVATLPRWAMFVHVQVGTVALAAWGYGNYSHAAWTLRGVAGPLSVLAVLCALLAFAVLRSEERRLARELRTARTGTSVLRGMIVRQRKRAPIFLRLFSTPLGSAAVLLADGDRSGALDALAASSPLMQGGRLGRLKDVVGADLERAEGNSVSLDRCVQRLRAIPPVGNREADLYRVHVLVKAILQQGSDDDAAEVAQDLAASADEDERLYAVWLTTWFELEALPEPSEGELRMAALLARAHGADKLVTMLDARIAGTPAAVAR